MTKIRALLRWFAGHVFVTHLAYAVLAGVGFYVLTSVLSDYNDTLVGEIALFAIVLAGLSLLTGVNGQISLGHGAFMAVGAYTIALLQEHTGWPLVFMMLTAAGAAAVVGLVVAIPATRLRGPYLAGMTLLVALALPLFADKYASVFGGDQGLPISPPTAPGSLDSYKWLAWIEILAALITLVFVANLMRSRFGRSFRAVRDDEIAAAVSGIHVARTKVTAFVVSAACAGLAGALYGLYNGGAATGTFGLTLSIQLLAAMVVGGAGTIMGVWWGAVLLVYLPQWSTSFSNHFNLGSQVGAYFATVLFGAGLIVVMMLAPSGIQGLLRWTALRIRRYVLRGMPGGGKSPEAPRFELRSTE